MGRVTLPDGAMGRGLLVPDGRFGPAILAPNDGSASGSSYSEAGPRPGSAVIDDVRARLRPEISGGQEVGVEVRVMSGGAVGRRDRDAAVLWRLTSETDDDDWRGHSEPVYLADWSWAYYNPGAPRVFDVATIQSSETPIMLVATAAGGQAHSIRYDWSTVAWGAPVLQPALIVASFVAVAALVLPSEVAGLERVLGFWWDATDKRIVATFSDDFGATWDYYSTPAIADAPFGTGAANDADRMRACLHRGDVMLLAEEEGATGDWCQYASHSLGASFERVEVRAAFGRRASVCAFPDGSAIGVVYLAQATALPTFLRIGSAFQPTSEATPVTIDAGYTLVELTALVAPDGVLYAWGRRSAVAVDQVICWSSVDGGDTWQRFTTSGAAANLYNLAFQTGDAATFINPISSCTARGWCGFAHNSAAAPATTDDYIGFAWLGGWGNVVAEHGQAGHDAGRELHRSWMMGWGLDSGTKGRTWLAFELPSDLPDWALTGTAGTLTADGMQISTVAATGYYTHTPMAWAEFDGSIQYSVEVTAGGSLASIQCGVEVTIANGANEQRLSIRHTPTGIRVWDEIGGVQLGTDQVVAGRVIVSLHVITGLGAPWAAGHAHVTWRYPGATKWTHIADLTIANNVAAPPAVSSMRFGNIAASTSTSRWRMMCRRSRESTLAGSRQLMSHADEHSVGRPLTGTPYPLPEVGSATEVARLALRGGPARIGEEYVIEPEHDYPIEAVFSPGLDSWRSADKTEQIIALDLGGEAGLLSQLGAFSVGLYLGGTNFPIAQLEGWNGAAWIGIGTWDSRLMAGGVLAYNRTGDTVRPKLGFTELARLAQYGELARGGWAYLGAAGHSYRIEHHRTGAWPRNAGADLELRLRLESLLQLSAAPATGDLQLHASSGLLVAHLTQDTYYSRFRLRIPGSQETPRESGVAPLGSGYYEITHLALGLVVPFGRQWGRGWAQGLVPLVDQRESRSGALHTVQRGPPLREWSMSWADQPVDLYGLRAREFTGTEPAYLGPSGAAPSTAYGDVWWQLWGMLEQVRTGELPVVAIGEIPDATGMVLDRTMHLFGSLSSAGRITHVQGSEGVSELVRVDPITVRGAAEP